MQTSITAVKEQTTRMTVGTGVKSMKNTEIVLADDHSISSRRREATSPECPDWKVVGEAATEETAHVLHRQHRL